MAQALSACSDQSLQSHCSMFEWQCSQPVFSCPFPFPPSTFQSVWWVPGALCGRSWLGCKGCHPWQRYSIYGAADLWWKPLVSQAPNLTGKSVSELVALPSVRKFGWKDTTSFQKSRKSHTNTSSSLLSLVNLVLLPCNYFRCFSGRYHYCERCFDEIPGNEVNLGEDPTLMQR